MRLLKYIIFLFACIAFLWAQQLQYLHLQYFLPPADHLDQCGGYNVMSYKVPEMLCVRQVIGAQRTCGEYTKCLTQAPDYLSYQNCLEPTDYTYGKLARYNDSMYNIFLYGKNDTECVTVVDTLTVPFTCYSQTLMDINGTVCNINLFVDSAASQLPSLFDYFL